MSAAAPVLELPEASPWPGGLARWLARLARREPIRHRVDPRFSVEIVEHAVATAHGVRTARSFVTCGLAGSGRPELVLTWLPPRLLGTPSAAIVAALRAVGRAVAAGRSLRPGSAHQLGAGAPLEEVGLSGLIFTSARPMPGLGPPPGALHAVAVTGAELALAARTSSHRVLSRLGEAFGEFPWPAWSTPRPSLGRVGEATALAALPRAEVPGLTAGIDGQALAARLPQTSVPALVAALRDPATVLVHGVVIPAEPDPRADGLLVWQPARAETIAISAPHARGPRTAGGFLHVAAGDRVRGRVLEDGISLELDPASRDSLCASLEQGVAWQDRTPDGEVRVSMA
jgi:hypothetical protein